MITIRWIICNFSYGVYLCFITRVLLRNSYTSEPYRNIFTCTFSSAFSSIFNITFRRFDVGTEDSINITLFFFLSNTRDVYFWNTIGMCVILKSITCRYIQCGGEIWYNEAHINDEHKKKSQITLINEGSVAHIVGRIIAHRSRFSSRERKERGPISSVKVEASTKDTWSSGHVLPVTICRASRTLRWKLYCRSTIYSGTMCVAATRLT